MKWNSLSFCIANEIVSPARLLPLIVASALFMDNMDATVIATSLPAIAEDLGTDPIVLKLVFTTYLLSLTVFIPISGWCADRFGAKHIFRAAIAVFMVGSIACGRRSRERGGRARGALKLFAHAGRSCGKVRVSWIAAAF